MSELKRTIFSKESPEFSARLTVSIACPLTSKPRYSDFRNARYPNEQPGVSEVFPLREGSFDIRADIFDVFIRWAYPSVNGTGNPLQPA
jgi:hypothetical protein